MKAREKDEIADRLFDGLAPPAPPPQLRGRVLAAARAEAGVEPAADVWTRIWENRWLRVIWITAVIALIIGHAALVPRRPPSRMVTAELHIDDGIAEFLEMIQIEESASPNLGRAAGDGLINPTMEITDYE
jgi:hypothetical protein